MSTALPGLWIPTGAFKQRDWWSIMGAIARGVTAAAQASAQPLIRETIGSTAGHLGDWSIERMNSVAAEHRRSHSALPAKRSA